CAVLQQPIRRAGELMRLGVLITIACLSLLSTAASAQDRHPEVTVADPFIELHSGPGRGYPVFYVAERGQTVEVLRRRTDWFQVRVPRGEEGWVPLEQMARTLDLDGEEFDVPAFGLEDYSARRWETGIQYGDFGGANVISAYGGYGMTENLSLELWVGQALGRFSDSKMVNVNILHAMFPDKRATPFFTLGAGTIETSPKATLVATNDRRDSMAHAGLGVRTYLTRRFVFRAEYKTYVVFTSRDDNEEVREWKAGFSFFF
ncbi:MAG: SH3 domain-containing protein, partial [Gammaproteobacteria bacterium]|nr:SH3 domain-containing protein [Gammaproteobacteria bacterium]